MVRGRYIAGIVLVLVGIGFLLDQQGVIQFGDFVGTYWPVLLIIVGIVHIATHPRRPVGGVILVLLGVFFQLNELGRLRPGWFNYVWPVVLIGLGLALLFSRPRRRWAREPWGRPPEVNDDVLKLSAAFGGLEERVRSQNFRGGDVEVAFGGAKIDLREAGLSPEGARLNVSASFGGVEILVPAAWTVRVDGRPFLGGVENKTVPPPTGELPGPVLEIRANAFLGGVTIKN